ncbi:ATP-dependent DNA helicase RecQ [Lewinella marina]|uniref:DNA helicase RecQ n=1 Tax=Neolewinella marina TaxID=438751 RepID=A0A2G0CGP4_9BACT|nr:DNA helicase RecQ [Neolewinella marina]NJB86377.1 ATP-dependent DNA helicase RecQ [Neolewinella marina]PHK99155.1 DNA helicase RecQ [Neolewinella marina]
MTSAQARTALKKYFGYDDFRPLQLSIIEHVYAGHDGIVLMPTGGGKSMCFQIPAVTMTGTAVVVSPLISLMKDQVDGLRAAGIRAAFLNSSQQGSESHAVEQAYENGELHLLYVSPEKLLSPGFFSFLKRRRVCLFAIDEAHCISAWGHDFRPDYTMLRQLKSAFPEVPVLALTATADRLTRRDMAEQLGIPDAKQFIASFNRPNLSLEVRPGQKRREQIVRFIRERPEQAGIVYCLSRKQTEQLAEKLREAGYNAEAYHAGLSADRRGKVQTDFINDKTLIVCATVAFGMGIDKSNVRWVIHYTLPKNLENYYQEIGRAGRDGSKADTLLFYSYNDYTTLKDMISGGGNAEIQLAKLERMKEYAESLACRRRILLNYFSEDHGDDCGNCDVCANPPERFDGTVLAQKALSAVARLQQSVGVGMAIDVLRGSNRQDILKQGYDQVKTYGAGRDLSTYDWNQYFNQLISLGYLYVAHEDYNKLRLAPAARRVLFEGETVELVKFQTIQKRKKQEEGKTAKRAAAPRSRGSLFDALRELRRSLAREAAIPPYLIFSDKTLEEMSAAAPTTPRALSRISGVGEVKLARFGDHFLQAIRQYGGEPPAARRAAVPPADAAPHLLTYDAYLRGSEVREIARERGLKTSVVYTHLARAYREGKELEITDLLPGQVMDWIDEAIRAVPDTAGRKGVLAYIAEHQQDGVVRSHHLELAEAYRHRNPLPTTP